MPGRIEFEFSTRRGSSRGQARQSQPMRILVMGDFSACAQSANPQQTTAIAGKKLRNVDIDNLDQLVRRMRPQITLQSGQGPAIEFTPDNLDDFHPDNLFRNLTLFKELRDLRRRLHSSDSYKEAAAQLRSLISDAQLPETPADTAVPADRKESNENDTSTLERLLGKPVTTSPQARSREQSTVASLISQVIAGQIVPEADPGQQVYFDAADQMIGDLMRQILLHRDFQELEALWRNLHFLVTQLELDEDLQLFVLDVSRGELEDDFRQAGGQLENSQLYRLLVEQGVEIAGGEPWSLLVGNYRFGTSEQDAALLAALGSIASHAGGPFLAEASPAIVGCDSLSKTPNPRDWTPLDPESAQRWQALRESDAARWIGLALPRILLRLPYGENGEEIDDFVFEELTDPGQQDAFLWGNPAFGCAALIAQAFTQRGWQLQPGDMLDIGDLPAHSYVADGESRITPCAEVYLTETAADKILDQGLMPVLSIHNTNRVRVLRFQSISDPRRALAGAWA